MKKVFLIGICGVSMSSLAMFLFDNGYIVKGYDRARPPQFFDGKIEVIDDPNCFLEIERADEIYYSSAFNQDFTLIKYAVARGKRIYPRGKLLYNISSQYEKVIAVAGSHGKSSVTAMIYSILRCSGVKPSLHVGAILKDSAQGYEIADKQYFVTEACEYYDNFLFLKPYICVVTNLESEHLDYFKTFKREKLSFAKFVRQSEIAIVSTRFKCKNLKHDGRGDIIFDVYDGEKIYMHLKMQVAGGYNAQDALFAIEVAERLNISKCLIKLGLEGYKGLQKRFEKVESSLPAKNVYLDYAHHPHEIESAYMSGRNLGGRLVALFQPHTYSRTKSLMANFVKALKKFDEVILFKTYPAREAEEPQVEEELKNLLGATLYCDCDELLEKLKTLSPTDSLLILGAGDLPEKLLEKGIIKR